MNTTIVTQNKEVLMSDTFKIGDTIKPKSKYPQEAKGSKGFQSLGGKIVDFLSTKERRYPIIENQDGDLHTVNPDVYEIAEGK